MNFTAVWLWVTITDRFPFKKCFGLQIHFTWISLSTHGISYIQRLMTAFSYFCLYNPVSSVFYAIKCFPSNLTHPNTIGHKGDFAVLVHPNGHNNIRKSTKVSFFHLWICLQSTNNVSVSSDLRVIYLFQFNYNMLENIVWLIIALLFVKQFFLGCPWANFSEAMFFTTRHTHNLVDRIFTCYFLLQTPSSSLFPFSCYAFCG